MDQTVQSDQIATTTTLTSSVNPSVFGQSVTFTATVTPNPSAGSNSGGTVTFTDGGTTLGTIDLNSQGIATFTTAALAVASHTIIATYNGNQYYASSYDTLTQVVNQDGTTTTVSSSVNPSVYGQMVTFTATVAAASPGSGTPTGTVTFTDGGTTLGTGNLNSAGQATWTTTSPLSVDTHTITATYNGDTNFTTSYGTLSQVVKQASTTTTLSSDDNPSVLGDEVTFSVTVAAVSPGSGTPTGNVTFTDDGELLDTVPLDSSGKATYSTDELSQGSHDIEASYAGDTNFTASSDDLSQDVLGESSTALTSSANPSVHGQQVTFTATVSAVAPASGTPTGDVDFFDGNTLLDSVELQNGVATYYISTLAIGTHTITAEYEGDADFTDSSDSLTQTVNKAASTVVMTSSANPSTLGEDVTFTATVSAGSPGSGTPTGDVVFTADGVTLDTVPLNSQGQATVSTSELTVGSHIIVANYEGDSDFTGNSATLTQTVSRGSTTTTLSSSANPSVYGQQITFTATVSAVAPASGTPTGTVTFTDGSTKLGTVDLDSAGKAEWTTSTPLTVGPHDITATYNGDTDFTTSSATLTQTVNQNGTTTTLTSSANPSVYGQSVTLTATVSAGSSDAGTPTGTVTFTDGGTTLGTVDLNSQDQAPWTTTTPLTVDAHSITATYNGDTDFTTSSAALTQTVNQDSTTTTLTSSLNSSVYGQSVTFTAAVSAVAPGSGTPTGTVTFTDDGTPLGTMLLNSNGVATLSTGALTPGSHDIEASYSGDSNFTSSQNSLTQKVLGLSSVTLTSSQNPSQGGQAVTFTATVSAAAPASGIPTGTVTFTDNGTTLGTEPLNSGGVATFTTSQLTVGSHTIQASYNGDSYFCCSSACLSLRVTGSTSTEISSDLDPSLVGDLVTFAATVSPVAPASGTPTGTVTFLDGSTVMGTVTLDSQGVARFTTSTLTVGTHTIVANYNGAGGYTGSSANLDQIVNLPIDRTNPGNQTNPEGTTVSLQDQVTDNAGATAYLGATNLPDGLSINTQTGLINGTISYSAAETSNGSYSVTITANDTLGNTASVSFVWTVTNTNTPPVLTNPGDQTNWQGDVISLPLTASDADGDTLTYSATNLPVGLSIDSATGVISGVIDSTAGGQSPYAVSVTASDGTLSDSQSFVWTVPHILIVNPGDQKNLDGDSVSLPVTAWEPPYGHSLTFSATGLSIDSTFGVITGTISSNASASSPYAVTVTATDGTDPASTSFTWTVQNFALENPGDQSNSEGDAVSLQLVVDSNASPNLTYSGSGLPAGLSLDTSSGIISGTVAPGDANDSPYTVTVSATDGNNTSSTSFSWTITHILVTQPDAQISAPGATASLQIQASDPDGDSLTYSATGLPAGLTIHASTGLISGTTASDAGSATPYNVTVSVSDGSVTATTSFSWSVTNGKLTVDDPGNQSNAEGDTVSLQIQASGGGSGAVYTFSATGLPVGLDVDSSSGLISGTVDYSDAETNGGTYEVTVMADDGNGDTGSTTFTWTISNTVQSPNLDPISDQLNQINDSVSLQVSASDPDGLTLTYSASGLPGGLAIDSSTGLISGTIGANDVAGSPYAVSVSVTNGTLSASEGFAWTVTNGGVTVTNPGDQVNAESNSVSLSISASSSGGNIASYAVTGLPAGLSIDTTTGLISGTVNSGDSQGADNGLYTVTVTATDTSGNSGGTQFFWTINPTESLSLNNPGPQTNAEGDQVSLQMQGNSTCGYSVTYAASGLPVGLSIDANTGLISGMVSYAAAEMNGGHYTVVVSCNDGAGGTVSVSFAWTITHTNQPPYIQFPGGQSNKIGDAVTLQLVAGDPDGDALTFSATGLPAGLTINPQTGMISGMIEGPAGTYNVTASVSDGYGSASTTFPWNVGSRDSYEAEVTLEINDTADHSDDVAILGAPAIPMIVTLENAGPGLHSVNLSVPTGQVSIDEPELEMEDGGSVTVWLTALEVSQEDDDVEIMALADGKAAGEGKMAVAAVTLKKIRDGDTPQGMPDRIPPRTWSFDGVTIFPAMPGKQFKFSVQNQSDENGRADVDLLSDTTTEGWQVLVITVGNKQTQTAPGHAGQLKVRIQVGNNAADSKDSAGFSVAAIPVKITMFQPQPALAPFTSTKNKNNYDIEWGVRYKMKIESDSGDPSDLDKVLVSEFVVPQAALNGIDLRTSSYGPAGKQSQDFHSSGVDEPKNLGLQQAVIQAAADFKKVIDNKKGEISSGALEQFFSFIDLRTDPDQGADLTKKSPYLVQFSGFEITVTAKKQAGNYYVIVTKIAKAQPNGVMAGEIPATDTKPNPVLIRSPF